MRVSLSRPIDATAPHLPDTRPVEVELDEGEEITGTDALEDQIAYTVAGNGKTRIIRVFTDGTVDEGRRRGSK